MAMTLTHPLRALAAIFYLRNNRKIVILSQQDTANRNLLVGRKVDAQVPYARS